MKCKKIGQVAAEVIEFLSYQEWLTLILAQIFLDYTSKTVDRKNIRYYFKNNCSVLLWNSSGVLVILYNNNNTWWIVIKLLKYELIFFYLIEKIMDSK